MNPRINVRNLAAPLVWGALGPGNAWHHIIPYSTLCSVWNALVDQHIATELPEARVALRQYLALCDRDLPNLDGLVDRIRAARADLRRAGHNVLMPLTVAESNQLGTAAVWPAWNIVEGPANRSDDPQDRDLDRFTAGLTAEEMGRMRAIETLYGALRVFVGAGPAPGASAMRSVGEAAQMARNVLNVNRPIRFRADLWEQGPDRRWKKRR